MNKTKKRPNKQRRERDDYKLPSPDTTLTLRAVAPDAIRVPLCYFANIALAGAVVTANNIFNLNSLFDPDRTGVGHQCSGFDQWSAFYNRYRVDKVRVDLEFVNNSAGSVTEVLICPSNDATAITTQAGLQAGSENPMSVTHILPIVGGMNYRRVVRTYSLNQIAGVTPAKYQSDDAYQAVYNANPTETIVLHVVAQDVGFASNISTLVKVKITYFAYLYDRNLLAIS